jgi:hypothetical protein
VLFGIFCVYGVSGYAVYAWRTCKGKPVSVIATSTDEPDEKGLHPLSTAPWRVLAFQAMMIDSCCMAASTATGTSGVPRVH